MSFRSLIRPLIQEMPPRFVGKVVTGIRLDANENPYQLSDKVREGLFQELAKAELNRYPDPEARELRALVAKIHELHPEQVLMGNGSDDLIQAFMLLFWSESAKLMIPVPTFGMYNTVARMVGYEVLEMHLDERFDLPVEDMVAVARREGPKLIVIASPNNPTGNRFSEERIIQLLESTDAIVVLDESYAPFCDQNFVPRIKRYENLVVIRSLSPFGLAGVRVGYMCAAKDLVYEANKARLPYSLDVLSQMTAKYVLEQGAELAEMMGKIVAARKKLLASMADIHGITAYPSDSNMILFKVATSGESFFRRLTEEGVMVCNLSKPGRLYNCFRVSVGSDDENEKFIEALKKSVS